MYGKHRRWRQLRPWREHSEILTMTGLIYIALGLLFFTLIPGGPRWVAMSVQLNLLPVEAWSVIFIASGICSILSSRWPVMNEKWGYIVLAGLSAGWGSGYLLGYMIGEAPVGNITTGLVWLLIGRLWHRVAKFQNRPEVIVLRPEELENGPN